MLDTTARPKDDGMMNRDELGMCADLQSQERISAFPFAQKYLKQHQRPSVLPITRVTEDKEPHEFLSLFGPAVKGGCACVII